MDAQYLITDPRPTQCFKDKTFSGFKKTDVQKALFKSIDEGQIEDACFWVTECVVSGYAPDMMDKLCAYASKVIHINNPLLPQYLWRRYYTFRKSIDHIGRKEKEQLIHIRNTQSVRNVLTDVVVIMCTSPKTQRYDKLSKVNPKTEFKFQSVQDNFSATMQLLPQATIRFTDPEELRVIMNEVLFHLKNTHGGYTQVCYWIQWLLQWEKREKTLKRKFEIETREINGVQSKYGKDMIWLVWEVVFIEANTRDDLIKYQIRSLFRLFTYDYTSGKRTSRLPYLYHCVGYLSLPLNLRIPLRTDLNIFAKTQLGVNLEYKKRKVHEVKTYTPPPKPQKKPTGELKEIIQSRIQQFQQLQEIDLSR